MRRNRKPITMLVLVPLLLFIVPAEATQASTGHQKYHGVMPDKYYDRLAQCETGGNWQHSTRSYTGGLGIYRGTWKRWSNSSSAKNKTARQQVKVADAIAFKGHTEPDGQFVYPVGMWGWGCVRNSEVLKSMICRSNKSVVKKWHYGCLKYK